MHDAIIADLYTGASDVPCERRAILAGGLPGAGKTTVLEQHAGIDRTQFLTINPDEIKNEMAKRGMVPEVAGLTPMEASDLVHEESSHIAKQLALRAMPEGKNVIWDITMSSRDSVERRITDLRTAGYARIEGIFVDIPVDVGIHRSDARHREGHDSYRAGHGQGGRFVPAEVIAAQADPDCGSRNRRTFEQIKPHLDAWLQYDNSVDGQHAGPGRFRWKRKGRGQTMTSEVSEMIKALRDGTMTLDQVAQQFRERKWPRRRRKPSGQLSGNGRQSAGRSRTL